MSKKHSLDKLEYLDISWNQVDGDVHSQSWSPSLSVNLCIMTFVYATYQIHIEKQFA